MKRRQGNQRRKQARALEKRTARKRKLSGQQKEQPLTPLRHARQAHKYPIEGSWVQPGWQSLGIAVVAIARRQPDRALVFGTYLVDLLCLGLKDTLFVANAPLAGFYESLKKRVYDGDPPDKISTELAHEIIYGGIEYAAQWGFRPHRDFRVSQHILDPPDTHDRTGQVKFGRDGKPRYIAGPRDNVKRILEQLTRTVGEENFEFVSPDDDIQGEEELSQDDQDSSRIWVREPGILTPDAALQHKNVPKEEDVEKDESSSVLWVPGSGR